MKLACGWTWILFQVCWTLEAPNTVTGPAGGSVSLQCQYPRHYDDHVKYWCKETGVKLCLHNATIRTTGSEEEVKQNRISIQDNHALHIFKVTIENLTNGDAGTYLCGVEKAGRFDTWELVEVKVTADFTSSSNSENKEQSTEETGNPGPTAKSFERIQSSNNVMFLVFKIPIFLAMIIAMVFAYIWNRRGIVTNAKTPAT